VGVSRNRSKGFGGSGICRSGSTTASGGSGSTARLCGRGEARKRERCGGQAALPHRSALAPCVRRRGAVKQRRGELPTHGGDGDGNSDARVSRVEAAAAAWG
jgi:hypothetical protein